MRGAFTYTLLMFSRSIPVVSLLVVYWIGLAIGTHTPVSAVQVVTTSVSDKTIHFYAYAGLGFLAAWAVTRLWGRRAVLALVAVVVVILFGAVDELTQPLVHRQCDFYDWVADTLGAILGALMYVTISWMLHSLAKKRENQSEAPTE